MIGSLLAQVESLKDAASSAGQTQDSLILGEQFYFFTVVLMWLIHAGFMSYETGIARKKNALATAMKNILTIAVVTPTFYYFGWWIYNCNQPGLPIGPNSSDFTAAACQGGIPWSDAFGPNLTNNINLVFFLAFLLFSWTTASIMSGAIIERARLSAYLVLACMLGSVVWILDAAWGWSAGGWLTLRFGFHDSIASGVVHGVAGAFTLGVLFNLGPRIGKYTREGLARQFRPHNLHMTLLGLMLIFTGFYAFYAACLVISSTAFPGWANIYLSPTTLGTIAMIITMGFAGGFTGGYFASRGDPFWTVSGGLAGVISVSAGADVYAPTLGYLIAMASAAMAVYVGNWIEKKHARRRRRRRRRGARLHGLPRDVLGGRVRRRISDRREQRGQLDRRPADRHGDLPAARLPHRLLLLVGHEEAEHPARAAGGRAHGPRRGRVRAEPVPAGGGRWRRAARGAGRNAGAMPHGPDEPRETRWWSKCRRSSTARPTASLTRRARTADDLADFILQDNYQDCAGFGTFMPGLHVRRGRLRRGDASTWSSPGSASSSWWRCWSPGSSTRTAG